MKALDQLSEYSGSGELQSWKQDVPTDVNVESDTYGRFSLGWISQDRHNSKMSL